MKAKEWSCQDSGFSIISCLRLITMDASLVCVCVCLSIAVSLCYAYVFFFQLLPIPLFSINSNKYLFI